MSLIYSRKAELADLDSIVPIIESAITFLKNSGSTQWQSGYPARNDIEVDIRQEHGYVLIIDGVIAGYAAVIVGSDPNYAKIKGSWLNETDPYATIHRLAISGKYRGLHLANFFISDLISVFRAHGVFNFRIDTGEANKIVQHLALAHQFKQRGIILVEDPIDPKRLAFELNLK